MKKHRVAAQWEKRIRAGSWLVVRSKEEILSTLDENACLDGLPFQPEMFAFCGRKMQVAKVAHKTCDNIKKTGGRRMDRAFHLVGSRCDGAMHGGCQADCVFYWKADWLRPDDGAPVYSTNNGSNIKCHEQDVYTRVRERGHENSNDPVWVCQTTALYDATELLHWWDVRQYVKDVTSGNHSAWKIIKLLTAAGYRNIVGLGFGYSYLVRFYNAVQKLTGGNPYPGIQGKIAEGAKTPTEVLDLQVGEWVEVKSGEEIASTLTENGFNRGMRYDPEMLKYSNGRYRVQMKVNRLIDEITGKMVHIKNPCIQLEDVYCRAECTPMRLGCPRASNTYWREIWLRRVDGPRTD
ncbi:MAG TPA: hypothetical protein PKK10_15100 [Woeseiaceae bacterium]|nr:hypothetical protein [Woeseiaceae bacterium]